MILIRVIQIQTVVLSKAKSEQGSDIGKHVYVTSSVVSDYSVIKGQETHLLAYITLFNMQ